MENSLENNIDLTKQNFFNFNVWSQFSNGWFVKTQTSNNTHINIHQITPEYQPPSHFNAVVGEAPSQESFHHY